MHKHIPIRLFVLYNPYFLLFYCYINSKFCCVILGSFEIIHFWLLILVLTTIIIIILSCFFFKNILNRFNLWRVSRREFYECGFKPVTQKSIKLSLQFIVIAIFFLIYDIELLFSFPLISSIGSHSLLEFLVFIFLYGTFIFSLIFDFDRLLTKWRI